MHKHFISLADAAVARILRQYTTQQWPLVAKLFVTVVGCWLLLPLACRSAEQEEIVNRHEASSCCLGDDDRRVKGECLQQQLVALRMHASTLRHATSTTVALEQAKSRRTRSDDVLAELLGEGLDGGVLVLLGHHRQDSGGADGVLAPRDNC